MVDRDKGTNIDKLLAEVESTLGGKGTSAQVPRGEGHAESWRGRFVRRVRAAVVSGTIAAGLVGLAFAVLPFLGALSGAVGAFLAAFGAALVLQRR